MSVAPNSRRTGPRAEVALPVTLVRAHGNPLECRTLDVGCGGMRVKATRPLHVDELLTFDLAIDGAEHVKGQCRVLREQVANCYAVKFEHLRPAVLACLRRLVDGKR